MEGTPMIRGPEKPELAFYEGLLTRIIRETAQLCGLRVSSIERDQKTVRNRLKVEGLSFLTGTLPKLGKCLDKALASDKPMGTDHSFGLVSSHKRYPQFLSGYFGLIFDDEGKVMDSVDVDSSRQAEAVRAIRQITYLFYKLDVSYGKDLEDRVIADFISDEADLPVLGAEVPLSREDNEIVDFAKFLVFSVLKGLDPLDVRPRHGPGSVATGEKNWEKKRFKRFYPKLDEIYSYSEYFFYNYTHLSDSLESLEHMETCDKATSKVVLVPKDSRGPRLISMEPLELQWIQQGLMTELVRKIESPSSITCGFVNFTDQGVNRSLALANSWGGELITLDLKAASDRVSVWLVKRLFPEDVFKALNACRSDSTLLPDGRCVELRKFAPMGSAVCFPVEALVFWALAVSAIYTHSSRSWYYRVPKSQVYVYGDDLVIPKEGLGRVSDIFKKCFLALNEDKCCTGSFFRESCGMDAFKMNDVTPLKIKARLRCPLSPNDALSWIEYSNILYRRGLVSTALYVRSVLERDLGAVPWTNNENPIPGTFFVSMDAHKVLGYNISMFRTRVSPRFHNMEVKILQPCPATYVAGDPDWEELLYRQSRARGGVQPPLGYLDPVQRPSPCHYPVPHQVKMRWRWVGVDLLLA